ncbi:MAG: molybdenum cofactor guanylyltransferase MobA [Hyphomicrobiales bacterium]|nr:molybdenum cofactor guanylyltransferase MobA [Hyphomicrobiales bacterium]
MHDDPAKPAPRALGVILGGGRGQRMGGDKNLALLAGRPLVAHAIERLRPQCARLVLNINADAAAFARFALPIAPDAAPGFPGPLAGILAGMEWAARADLPDIVTLPTDTPFAPRDLVARLYAARAQTGAQIAVAGSGGRMHPVAALWPSALAPQLRRALYEEDLRKVGRFVERFAPAVADWPATPFDPFFNVNTPQDLLEAEQIAARL